MVAPYILHYKSRVNKPAENSSKFKIQYKRFKDSHDSRYRNQSKMFGTSKKASRISAIGALNFIEYYTLLKCNIRSYIGLEAQSGLKYDVDLIKYLQHIHTSCKS
jgi:hypothetical protein